MKASAPLLPSSSKNNPFRKSNFLRSQSISQGGDSSPGSTESKRSKNRQNIKSRQQQPDLIVEEGFQLADQVNENEQNDSGNNMQMSGGYDMPSPLKNMDLPEVFEKYLLTTDVPFFGVRTTKAKIEPVKTPKTALNSKNGDDLSGGLSAKKFIPIRSKSRIQPSQSRVLVPLESKPSVDRSGKKAFEKESHSNVEKDSVKHDSPSKNSLDAEAEVKEKPAFITEAPRSQNSMEKQGSDDRSQEPQDSGFREAEDSDYSPSSEKNRQKALKSWKVPKTPQSPEKPQYDPWAVLNKIRNKEFAVPKAYDHGFNGYVTETDSLTRSKTSQPRDFTVMRSKKMNLFEGIPYVPYDVFLRQDANMQNVMLKDLLKILLDKAKSLKNLFHDNYRMDRIMKNIEEAEQSALNLHTEETIGLLNAVSSLIMQEFRDSVNQIGIKASPIFDNPNLRISGWENEVDRFYDNCNIFLDSIDHLRDCIDCYYVMSRQKDRKPIADVDCSDLLQFIARSRYNLGQLYEAFRVIEKHVDAKLIWDAQNDPAKIKEKMRKMQTQSGMNNKLKADTYKLLQELLQNKFNINRNKIAATRESKVVLNQEAEDEKFLTILQNQKQLKKKGGKALVDNRKLIILNRLLNPIEDPQIQVAIKIAQEKTQVQLGRDLVEYMASKAKVFEMKANINRDLPLKNNLEKILSNKNLTHLCFDFTDKEPQEIMHKLTAANKTDEMKELVNNVFSHTKTKRHLGCLFDKESSNHKHLHLHEPKSSVGMPGTPGTPGTQLPKLEKHLRKTFLQTR